MSNKDKDNIQKLDALIRYFDSFDMSQNEMQIMLKTLKNCRVVYKEKEFFEKTLIGIQKKSELALKTDDSYANTLIIYLGEKAKGALEYIKDGRVNER